MDKGLVVQENVRQEELQEGRAPGFPAGEGVRQWSGRDPEGRPDPQWVRGRCPECGDDLVSNLYYIAGKGYILCWECWESLAQDPACHYRKVL